MTDRYEIASLLGEDILGSVYLADDTMLQRRVMFRHVEYGDNPEVETRDDSWRKEFVTHAGKLSTMQHPNMLTIYDISIEESGAFVVTQFVQGESLAERLEQGPIGQMGVYRMAADMLEALHASHQSGVFHGALHTASIQRVHRASGGHRHLLVDLGLNQLASMVRAEKVKVADPVLMAPELHQENQELDAKADLFMLGQLCYTALVGGHPYSDKTTEECLEIYREEGMPPLENYIEGVEPEFASWVMRLVENDPDDRPEDSGEAMVALHSIQLNEPEPNVPGKTHAVAERDLPLTPTSGVTVVQQETAQVAVAASGYAGTNVATSSVHIAAANSATKLDDMNTTQTQSTSVAVPVLDQKKNHLTMAIVGVVVLLLIGGLIIGIRGRSGENENTSKDTSESVEHAVQIGKAEMLNTVAKQSTPVVVDLDDGKSLDWLVATGIPSSSKRVDKVDGLYIQSLQLIGAKDEHLMAENPVRFKSGGKILYPKASTCKAKGSKPGAGYEVQLRIPAKEEQSVTANLYVVQKYCDMRVEVIDPTDENVIVKVVPFTQQGVVKIPVGIDNPKPGDFYVIKVIATSASANGEFMIGISGVQIESR